MQDQKPAIVFDKEHASAYDKRFSKLSATKDALHLLTRVVLSELPEDARVLCVGVGTGAELLDLARGFPGWRFVAVEPAEAMLAICRQRVEEAGFTERCTFHGGYLDALPASEPFDAATSILVSHFFLESEARRAYYQQLGQRLRPGGLLVSASIAADVDSPAYPRLLEAWMGMLTYAEMPAAKVEEFRASLGRNVAVLPPATVAAMIEAGGFEAPTLIYQALLMHAWCARRGA